MTHHSWIQFLNLLSQRKKYPKRKYFLSKLYVSFKLSIYFTLDESCNFTRWTKQRNPISAIELSLGFDWLDQCYRYGPWNRGRPIVSYSQKPYQDIPKPLFPVGGIPIIQQQVIQTNCMPFIYCMAFTYFNLLHSRLNNASQLVSLKYFCLVFIPVSLI